MQGMHEQRDIAKEDQQQEHLQLLPCQPLPSQSPDENEQVSQTKIISPALEKCQISLQIIFMYFQHHWMRKICDCNPEYRSMYELERVITVFNFKQFQIEDLEISITNKTYSRNSHQVYMLLAQFMQYIYHEQTHRNLKQKDSKKFSVILVIEGCVSILDGKDERNVLFSFPKGSMFSEKQLLKTIGKAIIIVYAAETHLGVTKYEDIQDSLSEAAFVEEDANRAFLSKVYLFQSLSLWQFNRLCACFTLKTYLNGEIVFKAGSVPMGIYVIKSGEFEMVQNVVLEKKNDGGNEGITKGMSDMVKNGQEGCEKNRDNGCEEGYNDSDEYEEQDEFKKTMKNDGKNQNQNSITAEEGFESLLLRRGKDIANIKEMVVRMLGENELFGEEDIVLDYCQALQRARLGKAQEGSTESKNTNSNGKNAPSIQAEKDTKSPESKLPKVRLRTYGIRCKCQRGELVFLSSQDFIKKTMGCLREDQVIRLTARTKSRVRDHKDRLKNIQNAIQPYSKFIKRDNTIIGYSLSPTARVSNRRDENSRIMKNLQQTNSSVLIRENVHISRDNNNQGSGKEQQRQPVKSTEDLRRTISSRNIPGYFSTKPQRKPQSSLSINQQNNQQHEDNLSEFFISNIHKDSGVVGTTEPYLRAASTIEQAKNLNKANSQLTSFVGSIRTQRRQVKSLHDIDSFPQEKRQIKHSQPYSTTQSSRMLEQLSESYCSTKNIQDKRHSTNRLNVFQVIEKSCSLESSFVGADSIQPKERMKLHLSIFRNDEKKAGKIRSNIIQERGQHQQLGMDKLTQKIMYTRDADGQLPDSVGDHYDDDDNITNFKSSRSISSKKKIIFSHPFQQFPSPRSFAHNNNNNNDEDLSNQDLKSQKNDNNSNNILTHILSNKTKVQTNSNFPSKSSIRRRKNPAELHLVEFVGLEEVNRQPPDGYIVPPGAVNHSRHLSKNVSPDDTRKTKIKLLTPFFDRGYSEGFQKQLLMQASKLKKIDPVGEAEQQQARLKRTVMPKHMILKQLLKREIINSNTSSAQFTQKHFSDYLMKQKGKQLNQEIDNNSNNLDINTQQNKGLIQENDKGDNTTKNESLSSKGGLHTANLFFPKTTPRLTTYLKDTTTTAASLIEFTSIKQRVQQKNRDVFRLSRNTAYPPGSFANKSNSSLHDLSTGAQLRSSSTGQRFSVPLILSFDKQTTSQIS